MKLRYLFRPLHRFHRIRWFRSFRRRRWLLLVLAALLLAAALMQPTLRLPSTIYRYVFVFDITQSMNVRDAGNPKTDRLGFAKSQLITALESLPCGSQAGLALFTGHRTLLLFTPTEVCGHVGELRQMVASVDWRMAWEARSEVAKGLFDAIKLVADLGRDTRLAFITDGHEAPPLNNKLRPRFRGDAGTVKGLVVGVGDTAPSRIPKLDRDGKLIGYWQADEVMQIDTYSLGRTGTSVSNETMVGVEQADVEERINSGTEHLSSLREDYLRQLAQQTGLGYLRLGDGDRLPDSIQQSRLGTRIMARTSLSTALGALALLCLIAYHLPASRLGNV